MSHLDVVRAWKDEEYRLSLSEAERAALPNHPAGLIELSDGDLFEVAGGTTTEPCLTVAVTALTVAVSVAATNGFSCWPGCQRTLNSGTCRQSTIGCC